MDEDKIAYMSPEELAQEVDKILENPSIYPAEYVIKMILVLSLNEINFELAERMCRAFVGGAIEKVRMTALYSVSHIALCYETAAD